MGVLRVGCYVREGDDEMSELSFMGKLMQAMELSKMGHVGMELTYFDVIELLGEIEALKGYIAELEAELKNARELIGMTPEPAFPAWIPVSERLPEPNQFVLIYDSRGDVTVDYLVTFNRNGVAHYINADDGAVCWMPLPEPPEAR